MISMEHSTSNFWLWKSLTMILQRGWYSFQKEIFYDPRPVTREEQKSRQYKELQVEQLACIEVRDKNNEEVQDSYCGLR